MRAKKLRLLDFTEPKTTLKDSFEPLLAKYWSENKCPESPGMNLKLGLNTFVLGIGLKIKVEKELKDITPYIIYNENIVDPTLVNGSMSRLYNEFNLVVAKNLVDVIQDRLPGEMNDLAFWYSLEVLFQEKLNLKENVANRQAIFDFNLGLNGVKATNINGAHLLSDEVNQGAPTDFKECILKYVADNDGQYVYLETTVVQSAKDFLFLMDKNILMFTGTTPLLGDVMDDIQEINDFPLAPYELTDDNSLYYGGFDRRTVVIPDIKDGPVDNFFFPIGVDEALSQWGHKSLFNLASFLPKKQD